MFKPTAKLRKRVGVLKGGGMSDDAIALALGVSRGTLLKYFDAELTLGASKRRAEIMEAMYDAGKAGNVTAQKAYLARSDVEPPPPPAKEKPLGKKEQALLDAEGADAGTGWNGLVN